VGGLLLVRFEARIVKMGGPSHGSQAENRRTALGDLKDGSGHSTRIEHRFGLPKRLWLGGS
jgi:hypothetical protein